MVIAARYITGLISSTNESEAAVLHRFSLSDTSGAGSSGFFRVGLAFEKGDMPGGHLPAVRLADGTPVRSAVMETNSWSDGSMRKATLVGEVPGGVSGTADIQVLAAPGSQGTSGLDPFAYLSANTDFKVQVINHSGSVSGNLPNRTYVLNIALLTASRREIQADTPLCVRVFAWGSPASEKHLMCLHYVDLWLDQAGEVAGVEWTPVMSQHWWVDDPFGNGAEPKEERSYDAVLLDGTTAIEGYAGLHHAYYCQWAGLYTGNDAQHARRLWIDRGAAMPTLRLAYSLESKRGLMRAGYLPPLEQSDSYTIQHGQDYEALGANGHRSNISGAGGYEGRGVVTNMDGIAITEQTEARWRSARVSAQASLSVFHHIKDHRTAVGGAFGGDASLGLIPQKIGRLGAQTYPGLAAETIAVSGANPELAEIVPAPASNAPTSSGAFENWDAAHHTAYGFLMAFVEGERYLADAVLDQFGYVCIGSNFNGFGSDPRLIWGIDEPRATVQAVPSTPTYGLTHLHHRQERSFGWSQYAWDSAFALIADTDRHRPFLLNSQQNTNDLLEDSIAFFPASQFVTGSYWLRNPPQMATFMNGLTSLLFQRSVVLTEGAYPGYGQMLDLLIRYLRDTLIHNPYASRFDHHLVVTDEQNATQYVARDERFVEAQGAIDNSTGPGTTFIGNNAFFSGILPADGDRAFVSNPDNSNVIPPELDVSTIYHLVNVRILGDNDASWQIAATPGGTPITVGDQQRRVRFFVDMASLSAFSFLGQNGALVPNDDDFMTIMNAAIEYYYGARGSEVSDADIAAIRAFFAPKTYSIFSSWNLNGDLMR